MFCKNCGAPLNDDAKFCPSCGNVVAAPAPQPEVQTVPAQPVQPVQPVQPAQPVQPGQPVYQQPVYQAPVAPAQPNPAVTNFVAALKSFFVKPMATVAGAAKSSTHEWALLAGMNVLVYALATAVVGLEMITQLLNALLGGLGGMVDLGGFYPFFGVLGVGLLVGVASYFVVALGIWVLVTQIFKKQATFINVLNMVAVATLPMTAISAANMLFGLIYAPLTFLLFITAFVMTAICLYNGMQKLDKLDKSPFYGFAVIMAVGIIVAVMLSTLHLKAFEAALADLMGSALGSLGSMLGGSSSALGGLGGLF